MFLPLHAIVIIKFFSFSLLKIVLQKKQRIKKGTWDLYSMVMWCFRFLNGEAKEFLDHDVRASGSKASSLEVSDRSTETPTGSKYPGFPQRPSNLRIFTFSELKNATKNFSRSLMVGEGGFGCVYRGSIRSPEEPHGRIEIAVKQLNRSGMQASFL